MTRRSKAEVRGQTNSSSRRTHKNVRPSRDVSSKASQSSRGPSNLRNALMNPRSFRTISPVQASDGLNFGKKVSKFLGLQETKFTQYLS